MTEQERVCIARQMTRAHKEELENHIGHKFRRIHHSIDKFFTGQRESEGYQLTRAQSGMIHYLYHHRDVAIFQKDIEAVFSISGATATNCLKSLERQGFIQRECVENDGRLKKIVLTPEGVLIHERVTENILQMEQALTRGMSEEEITIYRRLLDLTIHNLEKMHP